MARNSEKAQSMLFRFREAQAADLGIIDASRTRRPKLITEIDSIPVAEKWRGQVLKEISRKMSRIQESALSDYQIRDLNDEINKLMREKYTWEVQIRNLGGPNYTRGGGGGRMYDEQGREIPGAGGKGYKYYGRARELPGVKEMIDAAAARARERAEGGPDAERDRAMKELRRMTVDAEYFGFGPDEEDEEMLAYEAAREAEEQARMAAEGGISSGMDLLPPDGWEPLPGDAGDGKAWELPTLQEVQQELMERRRRRLLEQL